MPRTAPLKPETPVLEMDVSFPGSGAPYRFRFYGLSARVDVLKTPAGPPAYHIFEGACSCAGCQNHGYCKHLDFAKTVWGTWDGVLEHAERFESEHGSPVHIALAPGWQDFYKAERPARPAAPPPPPTNAELISAWEEAADSARYSDVGNEILLAGYAMAARLRELPA